MAAAAADPSPAPFVVGVGRSGTTVLRLMLDAHPELAIPPETAFAPELIELAANGEPTAEEALAVITGHWRWADFGLDAAELRRRIAAPGPRDAASVLRAFYGLYAEGRRKPRWGDKTPRYARFMTPIAAALPEARFVHIIRDGRDVALSRTITLARKPTTITQAARLWQRWIRRARRQARSLPHYLEVRYEDLIADPEPVLRRICAEIELGFDPVMLDYHEGSAERLDELSNPIPARADKRELPADARLAMHAAATRPPDTGLLDRWRTEMSTQDLESFLAVAGGTLDELGYPRE